MNEVELNALGRHCLCSLNFPLDGWPWYCCRFSIPSLPLISTAKYFNNLLCKDFKLTWLLSTLGRGRFNDSRRSVRVASHDGKGGPLHQVLSDLQLRQSHHRTLDLALRKVQVQAAGTWHSCRSTWNDCWKGMKIARIHLITVISKYALDKCPLKYDYRTIFL